MTLEQISQLTNIQFSHNTKLLAYVEDRGKDPMLRFKVSVPKVEIDTMLSKSPFSVMEINSSEDADFPIAEVAGYEKEQWWKTTNVKHWKSGKTNGNKLLVEMFIDYDPDDLCYLYVCWFFFYT